MELTAILTPAPEGGYIASNPETGTTTLYYALYLKVVIHRETQLMKRYKI